MSRPARLSTLICSALLSASAAKGDDRTPATARLEWTRTEDAAECIDGPALGAAVERRWGRRVFVEDASATVVVKGKVGRNRRGIWSAHLELERTDGSRLGSRDIVTHAADCSALDDSVALALGLMLDLTEQGATSGGQGSAAPVSGPPITIPKETIAPRVPWHFEPMAGGEAALGLLPGPTLGARIAIAIEPPRLWRIEVGGTLWQHREAENGASGVRLSLWTVDLAVCPISAELPAVTIWGCIAQRAGMVHAQGIGFDRNAKPQDTLLFAEARLGATWTIAAPFALHAGFGLDAPLVRLGFVYRNDQGDTVAIYRVPPVAGILGLGIGARF